MPRSRDPYSLTAGQVAALRSPVRLAILQHVEAARETSASDLAFETGAKRPLVHYHLGKLLAAGLVEEAGHRGEGAAREAVEDPTRGPHHDVDTATQLRDLGVDRRAAVDGEHAGPARRPVTLERG